MSGDNYHDRKLEIKVINRLRAVKNQLYVMGECSSIWHDDARLQLKHEIEVIADIELPEDWTP